MTIEESLNEFEMILREVERRNTYIASSSLDVNILMLVLSLNRLKGQIKILTDEIQKNNKER